MHQLVIEVCGGHRALSGRCGLRTATADETSASNVRPAGPAAGVDLHDTTFYQRRSVRCFEREPTPGATTAMTLPFCYRRLELMPR